MGLTLEELTGLSKHQQARRLMDAVLGPSGAIPEDELRTATAELILWALNEESEPAPIDLVRRWIVECVWQVWATESGRVVRAHAENGADSLRIEREMRVVLEATVVAQQLPEDRPLVSADFEEAIRAALESMRRVGEVDE